MSTEPTAGEARHSAPTGQARRGGDLVSRVLLAAGGVGCVAYLGARPWGAESDPATFADPRWPLSHLAAMVAFVAIAAAATRLARGFSARLRAVAGLSAWSAVGLLLPYFGAEAYALHALGILATSSRGVARADLPDLAEAIRMGPIQATTFGLGWFAFAALGLALAWGLTRPYAGRARDGSAGVPMPGARAAAWLLAAGLATYLPVFFLPPAGRIAHAVLTGGAAIVLALRLDGRPRGVSARR